LWFEFGSYSVEFLSSIIDVVDKSIKYFLDTTRTLRDPHPLSLPLRQKKAGEGWESCPPLFAGGDDEIPGLFRFGGVVHN
jgi:hypothetical protein